WAPVLDAHPGGRRRGQLPGAATHFRFGRLARAPRRPAGGSMSAGLLVLRLVLVLGWTIGSQCDNDVQAAHTIYDKLPIKRIIYKRELKCKEREYAAENICCEMCAPGSIKLGNCRKDNKTSNCQPCTEGTFMDHYNSLHECRRCKPCDSELDLEVAEKCTITQDTKCRCKQHYFCNSPDSCHHCDPCSKCENVGIEKECTPTTNTICKRNFWWIYLIVVGIVIAIASVSAYCCKLVFFLHPYCILN
ncbi:Fas cell surface death receptor, partial [Chelydra serpentina]